MIAVQLYISLSSPNDFPSSCSSCFDSYTRDVDEGYAFQTCFSFFPCFFPASSLLLLPLVFSFLHFSLRELRPPSSPPSCLCLCFFLLCHFLSQQVLIDCLMQCLLPFFFTFMNSKDPASHLPLVSDLEVWQHKSILLRNCKVICEGMFFMLISKPNCNHLKRSIKFLREA